LIHLFGDFIGKIHFVIKKIIHFTFPGSILKGQRKIFYLSWFLKLKEFQLISPSVGMKKVEWRAMEDTFSAIDNKNRMIRYLFSAKDINYGKGNNWSRYEAGLVAANSRDGMGFL